MKQGRCSNFGICSKANAHELISIPYGESLVCPSCGVMLIEETASPVPTTTKKISSRSAETALVVGFGVLVLFSVAMIYFQRNKSDSSFLSNTGSGRATVNSGSQSNPVHTGSSASDLTLFYDGSDEAWMTNAAYAFNASRNSPHIKPVKRASREGYKDIVEGKASPTLWNPADTIWTSKLKSFWSKNPTSNKTGVSIAIDPVVLRTKVILLMHKDKAEALERTLGNYSGKTWQLLSDVSIKGWGSVGASGGKLRLSQASPTQSNSGALSIAMMYLEYKATHPGASTGDPGFIAFLQNIEAATGKVYAQTTSKAVEAFLNQPESFDAVICYESNAIDAIRKSKIALKVIYPDPTIDISSPVAVMEAQKTVTSDGAANRRIAEDFTNYLLSNGMQQESLKYGFRPALARLSQDVSNAFLDPTLANAGLLALPKTAAFTMDLNTLENLIDIWNRKVR